MVASDAIVPFADREDSLLKPSQPPTRRAAPVAPTEASVRPPSTTGVVRSGRHAAHKSGSGRLPGAYQLPPVLDESILANRAASVPRTGWRKAAYAATGGHFNPGLSARQREQASVMNLIAHPIDGAYRIAVLSIKGGVGKTTTTLGLGSVFARSRGDRIIAVDANPDRGTLAQRVQERSSASFDGLLASPLIERYSDVGAYIRTSTSRLEVFGSDPDPSVAEAFGEADYRRAVDVLQNYYSIILSDCGGGIMHSAMAGVLDLADAVVVVSAPSLDSIRSAAATLKWLTLHGYSSLARESQLVISKSRPGASTLKIEKVREHFEARCESIHLIPFDPHLVEGGEVDIDLLRPATYRAYVELAAAVAKKFTVRGPLESAVNMAN